MKSKGCDGHLLDQLAVHMCDLATLLHEFLPGLGDDAVGSVLGESNDDGLEVVCRKGAGSHGEGCENGREDAHLDGLFFVSVADS